MKFSCCSLDRDEMVQLVELSKRNEEAMNLFKLLSNPIRLRILQFLLIESEICTNELTELYGIPQPAVTKQLTRLRKEKILESRKITFVEKKEGQWEKEEKTDGKWTAYRLAEEKKPLITYLMKPFIRDKFQHKMPDCEPSVGIFCAKGKD